MFIFFVDIVKEYIVKPLQDIADNESSNKLCTYASIICFNETSKPNSGKLLLSTLIIDDELNKLKGIPMLICNNSKTFFVTLLYEKEIPFLFIFEKDNRTEDATDVKFYAYIQMPSNIKLTSFVR